MLAPYLVGLAALVVLPGIAGLALAFTEYDALRAPRFVGLANLRELLRDDRFRTAVGNSLLYIALAVPIRLLGALAMALLLLRPFRGVGTFRAFVYLPTIMPDLAWALIWLWILNPVTGPLNQTLALVGIDGPSWMTDPTTARLAIVLMMSWQIGEGFVVCLASLQDVPRELRDQVAVDGGSWWNGLRSVTLPSIAPALLVLMVRDTIFSFQANFVPALIVGRGGGPDDATLFLPMYVYTAAFDYLRFGYAAAITLAMYAITAIVLGLQFVVVRRRRPLFDDVR